MNRPFPFFPHFFFSTFWISQSAVAVRSSAAPRQDAPSPYGRSPTSRFDQLLAAEVGKSDASERSPVQAQGLWLWLLEWCAMIQ